MQAQIATARRTPEELGTIIEKVKATCRDQLGDLRTALADLREVFLTLFPDGLVLTPEWARRQWQRPPLPPQAPPRNGSECVVSLPPGNRRVWRAKDAADWRIRLRCDPNGI